MDTAAAAWAFITAGEKPPPAGGSVASGAVEPSATAEESKPQQPAAVEAVDIASQASSTSTVGSNFPPSP